MMYEEVVPCRSIDIVSDGQAFQEVPGVFGGFGDSEHSFVWINVCGHFLQTIRLDITLA